jgi:hypothetical protein
MAARLAPPLGSRAIAEKKAGGAEKLLRAAGLDYGNVI